MAYGEIAMSQLAQVDMTPEETAALQREATRLARLLSASEKFTAEAANPPVPGSRMGHAHTADLRDAYDIAGLLIHACEDHLRTALLVLKTGPLPSFALYTLLRAAADAIVRARHLLDPAISEQTRLARGMNERLDNINQLFEVMAALGRAHYDQRVQHLEHRALANGISVLREKGSRHHPAQKQRLGSRPRNERPDCPVLLRVPSMSDRCSPAGSALRGKGRRWDQGRVLRG